MWAFALTQRVSVNNSGQEANSSSAPASMTPDGRYVLFGSDADNLVIWDINGSYDVFVRDTQNNTTSRVSIDDSGNEANATSYPTAITPDGRYVLFGSYADNLVVWDTNGSYDVFVRDTQNNTTNRVSLDYNWSEIAGESYPTAITPDGKYVLFGSDVGNIVSWDKNGQPDVFIRDTENSTTTIISIDENWVFSNGPSTPVGISDNGAYILFTSSADNLVSNDTNGTDDIFVREIANNIIMRVNVNNANDEANNFSYSPTMTPDGRYVLFASSASNLVADDNNWYDDIFVRDLHHAETTRINVANNGNEAYDISVVNAITPDGRYVLFTSRASNLVADDNNWHNDIFVRDRDNSATSRVNLDSGSNEADNSSYARAISSDGRYVLFQSAADNLVPWDTNGIEDIFIRDTHNETTSRVSVDSAWNQADASPYLSSLSADGRYVLFASSASNLIWSDQNGVDDVFLNEWQIVLWSAPVITAPADGSYRNTPEIAVAWLWQSWADIKLTFLGNDFFTTVNANNEWSMQLPDQWDAYYTVYAQQKMPSDSLWGLTWTSSFTIDTVSPVAPLITTPVESALISTNSMTVIWTGEPGGIVKVRVGKTIKTGFIDGLGNWNIGWFVIVQGYRYGIEAQQTDLAGNVWPRSAIRTVYGVNQWVTNINTGDFKADLMLTKRWVSNLTSILTTNPNEGIKYTLDYANIGKWYATWVVVYEKIHENTCYTVASISGLNSDYVVEYSNDNGATYTYVPVWNTWSQDCGVTDFRIQKQSQLEAKTAVIIDDFSGIKNNLSLMNNSLSIGLAPMMQTTITTLWDTRRTERWDFNNDSIDDFVIVNHAGNAQVWYGWSTWIRQYVLTWSVGSNRSTTVWDFNNDGFDDVGIGNQWWAEQVWYGWSTWMTQYILSSPVDWFTRAVAAWDFNNDGFDDFVSAGISQTAYVALWSVSGVSAYIVLTWSSADTAWLAVWDFNNDGYDDIWMANGASFSTANEQIWYGGPAWMTQAILTWSAGSSRAAWAWDFNNDGFDDLLIGNWNWWDSQIWYGGLTWVTQYILAGTPSYVFFKVWVWDFNDDGIDDAVIGNEWWGSNYVWYGSVSWVMTRLALPLSALSTRSLAVGDMNNDSIDDVVFANYWWQNEQVWYGWTMWMKQVVLTWSVGNTEEVAIWDFNNDGLKDIVMANRSAQNEQVWYGSIYTTWTYTTVLASTGSITAWSKIRVQENIISGNNALVYSVYWTIGTGACNTGNLLVWPLQSNSWEIDISAISGNNNSICVKVDFSILTWNMGPNVKSLMWFWDNETVDTFSFDVKVKSGGFSWNTVTNVAYITSNSEETNTGNNVWMHVFSWLSVVSISTGWFGWWAWRWRWEWWGWAGIKGDVLSTTPSVVVDMPKEKIAVVEVDGSTPAEAIKSAVVQTATVGAWESVEVKMVVNPILESEKKCYTAKEVVDITLGKNTTNKDQLVYQALLKSYDLTIFTDTDAYKPENGLKRMEAAKMFTNFAKHVLCREAKTEYNGEYKDIEYTDLTLKPYIIQAYEYGILKGSNNRFRPEERISRKEFVAALIRMFTNEDMDVYWVGNEWDREYQEMFNELWLDSIVRVNEEIDRYDMSKIMYKLYYNTSYKWTEKWYVLPYGRN
jgi:hypothetical protein